jgi:hypothetical protein
VTRARLVTALVVLASALLLAATLTAYAWRALFDSGQFADRAVATLQDERVRTVVADRVTDQLIVPQRPELLAARPLVASVVSGAVGGDAFAGLLRRGVSDVHAAVFHGKQDTATLTLVDVAVVVAAALRELDPQLAAELKTNERVTLLSDHLGGAAGDGVRLARSLRVLAYVLAGLTLAAAGAALVLSGDRRRTAFQLGCGAIAAGVLIAAFDVVARALVLSRVRDPDQRAAAGAVWDAFLGDLRTAGWLIAGAGAVVAAAAGSLMRPRELEEPMRAAWRIVTSEPDRTVWRVVRGVALIAAGVIVIAQPLATVTIAATLLGVYAVYKGLGALLRMTYRPAGEAGRRPRARTIVVPAVATLLVAAAIAAFVGTGGVDAPALAVEGCNGHAALCDRSLDQITLPATHNSMSVPEPGWFASLQERPIAGQLEDGIRGLLIDTHYADLLPNGRTRTYFGGAAEFRQAISQDGVSDESVRAAERLRSRAGFQGKGKRGVYLCHTFCELGSTPLADVLDDIHDFLVTHPEDVLVVVNQDAITPEDFVAAVRAAGLDRYAFAPPGSGRWPTLREMIDHDQRLVMLAEDHAGAAPWYQPAYERLLQETPFKFTEPAQLTEPSKLEASCRANRGRPDAPLFLLNHWINSDPVPRPANAVAVNAYEPLLRRARTCERLRGRRVNLLAVDFYKRGDLFRVVDTLNGTGAH